jgi:hypothetical protein
MKQLITILLLAIATVSLGQSPISSVGTGEYLTVYLHKDGTAWYTQFQSNVTLPPFYKKVPNGGYVEVDGGQYHCSLRDTAGNTYTIINNDTYRKTALPKAQRVYGFYQSTVVISGGKLFIEGPDNIMGFTTFNHPNGITFIDLVVSSSTTFGTLTKIHALASDGTVWVYTRGNATAVKMNLTGVIKIASVGIMANVAITATDMFVWTNYFYSTYAGGGWDVKIPTSVKAAWVNAGAKFPFKEVKGNMSTLHIIDAEDNLFGSGTNSRGEVGNGIMKDWKPTYAASWENGLLVAPPTKIPGKWKNICKGNTIAFYVWAQNLDGYWHSWGRNKRQTLGNGITLPGYTVGTWIGEGDLPDLLNVPSPKYVEPSVVNWTVVRFDGVNVPKATDMPYPVSPTVLKSYHDSVVNVLQTKLNNIKIIVNN